MLFTHASSSFFHTLLFHALPFYAFTPWSPPRNANAYLSEFTTLTSFLTTEMTWLFFFLPFPFLLLNLTFRFTLPLSIYVSCYLLSAIESSSCFLLSYPNIPLFLYPRCSYITEYSFCSYIPKNFLLVYSWSWSFLDICLLPHLTSLFDIHVRTWFVGWRLWLYILFRLDGFVLYVLFVHWIWCAVYGFFDFYVRERVIGWGRVCHGQSASGAMTKRSARPYLSCGY